MTIASVEACSSGLEAGPSGKRTSPKAVICLGLGISSIVLSIVTGIPALLVGALALQDIERSRGRLKGIRAAFGGIYLGLLGSACLPLVLLCMADRARDAERRTGLS